MAHRTRIDAERLNHAAEVAENAVQSGVQPCAAIAVANRRETLWTHAVSGADTVTADTIFLLASISKPITACAILRLVEQGRLLLHKPVAHYLPEFTGEGRENITAFHLLTHTNGMDEALWRESRLWNGGAAGSCFEEACRAPLLFPPGSRCQYGTLSFAVLSELITRLGGQPYPDYLHDRMFAPLGMKDTGFFFADHERAAPVHNLGEGRDALLAFQNRAVAGGGLWSTAADLVALGQTLLNDGARGGYRLLGPAAIETMTRLQTGSIPQIIEGRELPFHYGLGWGKGSVAADALGSPRAFEHGGATGTLFCIDPEWDLIFVYLTNTWGDSNETARQALNAVYGALAREGAA